MGNLCLLGQFKKKKAVTVPDKDGGVYASANRLLKAYSQLLQSREVRRQS